MKIFFFTFLLAGLTAGLDSAGGRLQSTVAIGNNRS
jgi:hypothetical protein